MVSVDSLVDRPTDAAMIDHYIFTLTNFYAVQGLAPLIPRAHTQIADDDVVSMLDFKSRFPQTDSVSGRGLSCNGNIGLTDNQISLKYDRT